MKNFGMISKIYNWVIKTKYKSSSTMLPFQEERRGYNKIHMLSVFCVKEIQEGYTRY